MSAPDEPTGGPYAPLKHSHVVDIEPVELTAEPAYATTPLRVLSLIALALFIVIEVCALAGLTAAYLNGWRP